MDFMQINTILVTAIKNNGSFGNYGFFIKKIDIGLFGTCHANKCIVYLITMGVSWKKTDIVLLVKTMVYLVTFS